jgi:hypothetical protein
MQFRAILLEEIYSYPSHRVANPRYPTRENLFISAPSGFLLGETEDRELLKDPTMMKRLNDIAKFPEQDKTHILYTIDAMINNVKLKAI